MRVEGRIGLLLNAVSLILNRFTIFPENISYFLGGLALSLGIFFMVINLLPETKYNNLYYRKLFEKQ